MKRAVLLGFCLLLAAPLAVACRLTAPTPTVVLSPTAPPTASTTTSPTLAPTPSPTPEPTSTPTPTSLPAALEEDIAQAREAGRSFLIIEAGLLHPEWKDAELVSPRAYEDVDGNTIAYMFAIAKQGVVVGRIVVGSKNYLTGVLEASAAPPPHPLTKAEVRSLVESSLGLRVEEQDIVGPLRHVYGGYFFFFDIYDVNGQQVAVHPVKRQVSFVSDLRTIAPQPTTKEK